MEVDPSPSTSGPVVPKVAPSSSSTSSSSGLSVALHPLVIMNISEHWTRTKAQEGTAMQVRGKGVLVEFLSPLYLRVQVDKEDRALFTR